MPIRARAPTRIDFAGGTTDLPSFRKREGGAVVSAAIDRYAYCSLTRCEGNGFRIVSQDLEQFVEAANIRELEYDGNLDLLKAAIRALDLPGGICVNVRCDAPPGSGTGSSASVGVALLGLLDRLKASATDNRRQCLSRFEIAEMACNLEHDLGIVGGKQDQYAAAVGGFNYMEFYDEHRVIVEPLELRPEVRLELHKHLLLCYSGQSRLSGDTNQRMISAYESNDPVVCGALRTVKRVAMDIRRALIGADIAWLGELLEEEWQARSMLAPGVVTERLQALRDAGINAGAVAAKVCGAGGGGCLLFLCADDAEAAVSRALEAAGGRIISFGFDFRGLEVWQAP
ncbi:MAG: GHMP kinase [Armatimonadetes bacterium]|nr:GHMP kinase [Armatimonadota bacterium]